MQRMPACVGFLPGGPPGLDHRPRFTGESGSPSIWVTRPSLTKTSCPQPTAQKGQTDLTTLSAICVLETSPSVRRDRGRRAAAQVVFAR